MARKNLNRTVTLILKGSERDGGDVRLDEFVDELNALKNALVNTERIISKLEKATLFYKVIDLKHESPATITLEAMPINPEIDYSESTLGSFFNNLNYINTFKKIPEGLDMTSVEAYRNLGIRRKPHIEEIIIRNGSRQYSIGRHFDQNIVQAIGKDEYEDGSIVGKLDSVNVHNRNRFFVYPEVGASKIECFFSDELRQKVKDALYRKIEVVGKLRYKTWDKFPYGISATDLNVYPEDEELCTFSELLGVAPDATGGLTVNEFIDKIRNEEW